jgi:hypothetical protein
MSTIDKRHFNFDPKTINWKQYMEECYLGIRKYSLKEQSYNQAAARARLAR